MAKWIIGIVVVVLAGVALWWSGWLGTQTPSQTATTTAQSAQPQAQAAPTNGMSTNTDTSDVGLAQDTAAVDSQMQGLNSDSASVDSSLNDKSVTQTY